MTDTAKRQPQDDMWEPEDSNLHESVKINFDEPLSECHTVPVITISADEGTAYWQCLACKQPCNILADQPVKSEYKKTCLNVDCPERKGGECTASVEPVKSVGEDELREKLRELFFKAAGGISNMAEEEIATAMQLIAQEAERHADAVIGEDLPNLSAAGGANTGVRLHNSIKAEQRNRNHYQGRGE